MEGELPLCPKQVFRYRSIGTSSVAKHRQSWIFLHSVMTPFQSSRMRVASTRRYRITNSFCISPVTIASVSPINIFTSERIPKSFK